MYYVEIRSGVHRQGAPRLVPLAQVRQETGFRSVVAYDETVVALIREQGGTYNLRGQAVYGDTLFMDFDGHDPTEFRAWLKGSGLAYEEFDSGNRSVHFHIPLQPIYGPWVTDAMKEWTKLHAPTADVSFLHPSGMYRLTGTYHAKRPGKCKTRVCVQEGRLLTLEQPTIVHQFVVPESTDEARTRLYTMLTASKSEGHRAPYLWLLAATAAEAGLSFDAALEHLRFWNQKFAYPPRDDLTLQRQCESAYRRITRKNA